MSRVARAHLDVTVTDDQLTAHSQKLSATKQMWIELRDAVGDFKLGPGVSQLGVALKKIGEVGKGLSEASTFISDVARASQGMSSANLEGAAKALKGLASVGRVDQAGIDSFKQMLDALNTVDSGRAQSIADFFTKAALITPRQGVGLDSLRHAIADMATVDISKLRDIAKIMAELGSTSNYAEGIGRVLKAQADDLRTIKKLSEDIDRVAEKQLTVEKKITKEKGQQRGALKRIQQDFIRVSAVLFIMYHNARALGQQLKSAAAQVDLMRNLTLSVDGFAEKMEKAKAATRGTVAELEIMKSMALMSSFGISIENFDQQMLMVQKMARRTGQDTEYLMNSLATGVSRLSPMILDNLGLQISLSTSYDTYAAAIGRASSALTPLEQKTAVMNEVMRQSAELTKDIEPVTSLTTRLERIDAAVKDTYRGLLSGFMLSLDASLRGAEERVTDLAQVSQMAWMSMEKGADSYTMKLSDFVNLTLPDALSGVSKFAVGMAETLGLYNKEITLGKDQITNLKTQADVKKKILDTSRSIFNALEREREARQASVTALKEWEESPIARNRLSWKDAEISRSKDAAEELLAITKNMAEVEARSFFLSERGVKLLEQSALYEAHIAQTKETHLESMAKEVQLVHERRDAIRDQMKTQEGMFEDDLHRRMAVQIFEEHSSKAFEAQEKSIASGMWALTAGYMNIVSLLVDVESMSEMAQILATERHRIFMEERAFAQRALREQQALIVDGMNASKNQLTIQYQHEKAAKELNEEVSKYNDMMSKSMDFGAKAAEFNRQELIAQGDIVLAKQKEVAAMADRAKYQKIYQTAAQDVTWLSKQERLNQATLLAGGRNRVQVEHSILKLKADILKKEESIVHMLKLQATIQYMTAVLGARIAQGFIDKAKLQLDALKEETGREIERIKRFPMESSGGRGRGGGSKTPKLDGFTKEIVSSQGSFELVQAGKDSAYLYADSFQETFKMVMTKQGKITFEAVAKSYESLGLDIKTQALRETNNIGGLWIRPRQIKEDAEEALRTIQEFVDRVGEKLDSATHRSLMGTMQALNLRKELAEEEIKALDATADRLDDVSKAMQNAFGFGDMARMFGRDFKIAMDEVTKSSQMFSDALKQQELNTYDLVAASGPAIRGVTAMFLTDAKERAAVEMILNVAQAWAAAATQNYVGAAMHGKAAVMFGLVAGGVLKLPGGASSATKEKKDNSQKGGPLHIHLYGDSMATEGERARHIEQIMAEARAEGRV